jgi:hypothetical protein
VVDLPDPQHEEDDPASTFVLTTEGWEVTEYVAPEKDWVPRSDGSFESPDGTMRTWTPADPAGG